MHRVTERPRRRSKLIVLQVSPAVLVLLYRAAALEGLSLSAFVRSAVLAAARQVLGEASDRDNPRRYDITDHPGSEDRAGRSERPRARLKALPDLLAHELRALTAAVQAANTAPAEQAEAREHRSPAGVPVLPRLVWISQGWEDEYGQYATDHLGLFMVPDGLDLGTLAAQVVDRSNQGEFLAVLERAGATRYDVERFQLSFEQPSWAGPDSPAALAARPADSLDLSYQITCEACPTQAEGTVNGWPCYFRARHGTWRFCMPALPDGNPALVKSEDAGTGAFYRMGDDPTSGWMEEPAVEAIIRACARQWVAEHAGDPLQEHERLRAAVADPASWSPRPSTFVAVGRVLHHFMQVPLSLGAATNTPRSSGLLATQAPPPTDQGVAAWLEEHRRTNDDQ